MRHRRLFDRHSMSADPARYLAGQSISRML